MKKHNGHVAEHPVGVEVHEWEHLRVHQAEIGDIGTWNLNIWIRKVDNEIQWKCTVSPQKPFAWQAGYDTEYDAINNWMHVGDEYDGC
jgi:hypothetical protein